jgi:hypothetical protein
LLTTAQVPIWYEVFFSATDMAVFRYSWFIQSNRLSLRSSWASLRMCAFCVPHFPYDSELRWTSVLKCLWSL